MPLGKHSNKATKERYQSSDMLRSTSGFLSWLTVWIFNFIASNTLHTDNDWYVTCVYTFLGAGWPSPKLQARVNAGPVSVASFRTFTANNMDSHSLKRMCLWWHLLQKPGPAAGGAEPWKPMDAQIVGWKKRPRSMVDIYGISMGRV